MTSRNKNTLNRFFVDLIFYKIVLLCCEQLENVLYSQMCLLKCLVILLFNNLIVYKIAAK